MKKTGRSGVTSEQAVQVVRYGDSGVLISESCRQHGASEALVDWAEGSCQTIPSD
jgi:hypothetical protein